MASALGTARLRAVRIPGVVMLILIVFWGADLALRGGLNWTQLVWLFISSAILSLVAMPILVPITLGIDYILRSLGLATSGRLVAYAVLFALIGAGAAFGTGVISPAMAIAGGLTAGILIAKVCVVREGMAA